MIPAGFRLAGVRCGLKNRRNDLGLIVSDQPARAAGVLTTNVVRAACVDFTRKELQEGFLDAIVVNSGNANCCTGLQGERDTATMAQLTRSAIAMPSARVAVASTGVIGQLLDMAKVERGIEAAAKALDHHAAPFFEAILTTDLVEKWALTDFQGSSLATPNSPNTSLEGPTMLGIAKGSGMIAPNMATMLAFIITDADLGNIDLQCAIQKAAANSFNRMLVDGDTSTNDMVLVLGNGASGQTVSPEAFQQALDQVCISLAKQVARDGEGATKLIEVRVTAATGAEKIARTIAESPLVKTAMFGCDPNWGRMMMAAGRAGVPFDVTQCRLSVIVDEEENVLFEEGGPTAFDPKHVSTMLKSNQVMINLWLSEGETETIYTCDLGYGYVRINAEYHT